jgi:hypothetical protein
MADLRKLSHLQLGVLDLLDEREEATMPEILMAGRSTHSLNALMRRGLISVEERRGQEHFSITRRGRKALGG